MRRSALAAPLVLPLVMLASACGTEESEGNNGPDPSPSPAAGWEAREASHGAALPRLVVSAADSGAVHVIDVASGETAGSVEATGPALLSAASPSGGQVFLVQTGDDTVQLLDAGIRYTAHGDHADPDHVEPALVEGAIEVPEPSHALVHGDHAAVFADGDGSVSLVNVGDEAPDELAAEATTPSGTAHQGVAIPLGHDIVASRADSSGEVTGVQVLTEDGDVEAEFDDCPDLRGAFAPDSETALFGCSDGVLKVHSHDGTWEATKIDAPEGGGEDARVTMLAGAPGAEQVLGSYSDGQVAVIDTAAEEISPLDLPADFVTLAWDPFWEQGLVLTSDGSLHAVDPANGEITHSTRATGEVGDATEDGGRAAVVAGENYAYVVNPTTRELAEVSVGGDGLALERAMTLDFTPRDLAIVGLAELGGHEEHEHTHEEGHDHSADSGEGHDHAHDEEHDHAH
ncbi:hypothetical protein SAMN02745673_02256 [Marinactinospora thermotolerans DSM 45154]|uniref:40-residue YVTN family beta-propeller repeat-containing protein n=1 Tax=Marinactinospora thermotolerans DSM 45154 TaxID=1122192 RepID=A0A1T4QIV7_9ACTN|nr:hypothetical protein [Marinactinospora thermotolerans]SKA03586.1 hypothetical protein SAMN02745673_02256 [Marinactinospora thermotolerans DSM 45154]